MGIATVNPATGETLRTFPSLSQGELEERLVRSQTAFRSWRRTPFSQRAEALSRLAALLETEGAELARWAVVEMGKPLRQAMDEVRKCALTCRYYAEHGERFLTP